MYKETTIYSHCECHVSISIIYMNISSFLIFILQLVIYYFCRILFLCRSMYIYQIDSCIPFNPYWTYPVYYTIDCNHRSFCTIYPVQRILNFPPVFQYLEFVLKLIFLFEQKLSLYLLLFVS